MAENQSKFCMTIELDQVRSEKAGYDFNEIRQTVNEICMECGGVRVDENHYIGRGTAGDCSVMANIVKSLKINDWFWDVIKVWTLQFPNDFMDLDKAYRYKSVAS